MKWKLLQGLGFGFKVYRQALNCSWPWILKLQYEGYTGDLEEDDQALLEQMHPIPNFEQYIRTCLQEFIINSGNSPQVCDIAPPWGG